MKSADTRITNDKHKKYLQLIIISSSIFRGLFGEKANV